MPGGNANYLRTVAPGTRDHFVYWLYGKGNTVLYIGCTRRPEARWREHCDGSHRAMVKQVVRRKMAGPYDYETARRIERDEQLKCGIA